MSVEFPWEGMMMYPLCPHVGHEDVKREVGMCDFALAQDYLDYPFAGSWVPEMAWVRLSFFIGPQAEPLQVLHLQM